MASDTDFSGVSFGEGAELYGRPNRVVGAWPTEDGLIMTYVAGPIAEFPDYRADIEGNLLKTLDQAGDLGMRVRAGQRAERIRTTPDVPDEVRRAYGPIWALVGDAGVVMDPITGAGIGHALCLAESLSEAVVAGLGGSASLEASLATFERSRDATQLPIHDLTLDLASFRSDTFLFVDLQGKQEAIDRFFGVLSGAISPSASFTPVAHPRPARAGQGHAGPDAQELAFAGWICGNCWPGRSIGPLVDFSAATSPPAG